MKRVDAAVGGAVALLVVYVLTLAPGLTFWDAGEFIAAAHSLGIPHPPGTPLFIVLLNVWAKLWFFLPYAVATNLFSAFATALAALLTARLVARATGERAFAVAGALTAGTMSSVWLNATETEVYAAALALGALMLWAGDAAGRGDAATQRRHTLLLVFLFALAVPLHLSALVAAPAAIALAANLDRGPDWRRAVMLAGGMILAMGIGRMSLWMTLAGAALLVTSQWRWGLPALIVAAIGASAIVFMLVRATHDPEIDQGHPATLSALADMVARRQYAVSPILPRSAPAWIQLGNLAQYADWQIALSFEPTVVPSILRTAFTMLFLVIGFHGARTHWRADRRTFVAFAALLFCGAIGVVVYLNLHAGPSIAYGIIPADTVREARERDYFFVYGFWGWGFWAGIGAITVARRLGRPAWAGVLVAALPLVLNWRAVTRRAEPEASLPAALAAAFLSNAPENAVLFLMGDNDSYPLWHAQRVLGTRRDVALVTVPLLPTRWYREQLAERYKLLPPDSVSIYRGRTATVKTLASQARALGRPVAASATMTVRERSEISGSWTAAGLVFVEGPDAIDTVAAARAAAIVLSRLGDAPTRPAIDPVNSYFRRVLDCPRQLVALSVSPDSIRLDSACNYR